MEALLSTPMCSMHLFYQKEGIVFAGVIWIMNNSNNNGDIVKIFKLLLEVFYKDLQILMGSCK